MFQCVDFDRDRFLKNVKCVNLVINIEKAMLAKVISELKFIPRLQIFLRTQHVDY